MGGSSQHANRGTAVQEPWCLAAADRPHGSAAIVSRDPHRPPAGEWARQRGQVLAVCGLLVLAVALVFGRTISYEFVNFDDNLLVSENPHVAAGLTASGIVWACTARDAHMWFPLTRISYMLDGQLFGLRPWGYHLTNVLLHAAATILLFLVLWRLTGVVWSSAFVAAVFAVHPLQVETVAWVGERKGVLSGLFFMLTIAAYYRYARYPFSLARYLPVVVLLGFGLLAKPVLVTIPVLLLLLDYWPLRRFGPPSAPDIATPASQPADRWSHVIRLLAEKIPLLLVAAAAGVAAMWSQGDNMKSLARLPLSTRIANALVSYCAYLGQALWPAGLAVFYPFPEADPPVWAFAGSLLLLAGASVAAMAWRRSRPFLLIGWLWYLVTLAPVIGLIQVGNKAMADRYMYLPLVGPFLALAWATLEFAGTSRLRRRLCGLAGVLVLAALTGRAWQQTGYWRDSETLWRRALACTSRNFVARSGLGLVLAGRGQMDAAIAEYRKALEIAPEHVNVLCSLGDALADLGRMDEACAAYRKALDLAERQNQPALAEAIQTRLRRCEAVTPYREPPPAPAATTPP